MAEIEHFVDPKNKKHPRFVEVKDLILNLYSADRQLAGIGPVLMNIGEAVKKVSLAIEGTIKALPSLFLFFPFPSSDY